MSEDNSAATAEEDPLAPRPRQQLLRGGAPNIAQGKDLSSDEEDLLLASVRIGVAQQQGNGRGQADYEEGDDQEFLEAARIFASRNGGGVAE